MLRMTFPALLLATTMAAGPSAAQGPGAVLLGEFRDWTAAAQNAGSAAMCFAYTQPKSSEPKGVNRDPVYLYITHRPGEGVRNEVSVKIGYPLRENSTPSLAVGPQSFEMYVRNDTAWLLDTGDEAKLLEAMRRGRDLTVKGTSKRGTNTTDTFSLGGIQQALDRISQECKEAKPAARPRR